MDKWYQNAVMYGIDIDVFKDSNGDGIGDFRGAAEKLDYLADLGVNCLWLLPYFYSPGKDNGYDIADYLLINPCFGSTDDFVEFLQEAEKRSMRVIIDLVVNHTSDEHPWFKAARYNKHSEFYNYYLWRDKPPNDKEENVFKKEESSTWKYDELNNQYYYHKYYHFEPNLNFKNPQVRDEVERIMQYWMGFGIAGFRIDAATHLFDQFDDGKKPTGAEVMNEFYEYMTKWRKDAVLLAEADVELDQIERYIGDGDRMHMLFNFLMNNWLFLSLARKDAQPVIKGLKALPDTPKTVVWVNFIRNLDELDLEQLSEEERAEVFEAFAPNPKMQIYGRGIRRRAATMLQGHPARLKMAFNLLFAMPGAPMIVYGDEIGMGDNLIYPQREAVRTPMQWDDSENGGFSSADKERIRVQPINHGVFGYKDVNVAEQLKDEQSLLMTIRRFIAVRKDFDIIGHGKPKILKIDDAAVLGLKYENEKTELLIFINFSGEQKVFEQKFDFRNYKSILEDDPYGAQQNNNALALRAYGYRWLARIK
ncbi:Trehalose synthase [Fulvivirga imtechensis AK7]|uniref:Trehalose synthase n=1 Tax=Fulvivirga imtechensis AK7 TaxID=1237149 RepID=L8JJF0_9BACT|nr:alpha-amylase family protein [Fulvivirga imtechensis]ELR68363.1 Trehalose synthase [Fulvivirga imtechensis AK7]